MFFLFFFFCIDLQCNVMYNTGIDRKTADSPGHISEMSKCHPERPFCQSEEDNKNRPIAACDFEKRVCLLDVVAACYCSTFIYSVTGRWALWWERLMAHLHPTNHSCPQSNVCRTTGRCRERGKCLSCAGRYQANRKRCLPLRAVMMMMMMIMCVCVHLWVCLGMNCQWW